MSQGTKMITTSSCYVHLYAYKFIIIIVIIIIIIYPYTAAITRWRSGRGCPHNKINSVLCTRRKSVCTKVKAHRFPRGLNSDSNK